MFALFRPIPAFRACVQAAEFIQRSKHPQRFSGMPPQKRHNDRTADESRKHILHRITHPGLRDPLGVVTGEQEAGVFE